MNGNTLFFGRSGVRRSILEHFILHPGVRVHVRQLARDLGTLASVLSRELRKLEVAGVLTSEMVGRARVYRWDERSGVAREASALFQKTHGIEPSLRQALAQLSGIERALVFGSHAAGTERPDSDLDVLIIGDPSQAALSEVLMPLEDRLGREIHTTTMSAEEFERRRERAGFVSSVLSGPRIEIIGTDA